MVHLWAAVLVSDQGLGEDARHGNVVAAATNLLASDSHTFAVAKNLAVTCSPRRRNSSPRRPNSAAAVVHSAAAVVNSTAAVVDSAAAAGLRPRWRRCFTTTLPMG